MDRLISNCPLCEEKSLHVLSDVQKELDNQQCINCGYVTSHLFKLNNGKKEDNEKYKSLTDEMKSWSKVENDRVWFPTIMTLPSGMLYPINLTVPNDDEDEVMKWAFAPMVDIPTDEQKKYPIPNTDNEFYKQRYDTDNGEIFDEFILALGTINKRVKDGKTQVDKG